MTLYMAANRNEDGYDITSQNYFSELGLHLGEDIVPATRQSFCTARKKLHWTAFEYLLRLANQDYTPALTLLRYKGHVTRAIDGTRLTLPRSEDLLAHFELPKSKAGFGHYPAAMLVTAVNVFTGQPSRAMVDKHTSSERVLLRKLMENFEVGDLSLLDRGFGGAQTFLEFDKQGQYFVCRMKTYGDKIAIYIQDFLCSRKKQKSVKLEFIDACTGEKVHLRIRLIRGGRDSEGKPIVFATNLKDRNTYSRASILKLYRERWSVETMYGRIKNLLKVEKFHARSYNGVMQELYANLLFIALTALIVTEAGLTLGLDRETTVPSFKNATAVIKRHLFSVIDTGITKKQSNQIAARMIEEVSRVLWKKQPGRSYPRVSRQPIKSWNLAKNKKLADYASSESSRLRRSGT
jgi:Transposase DDE domain